MQNNTFFEISTLRAPQRERCVQQTAYHLRRALYYSTLSHNLSGQLPDRCRLARLNEQINERLCHLLRKEGLS